MTEQQIREGYERLDSALSPPPDAPARVQRAVSARRQRRRITLAGAGALAVTALAGALVVVVSGDDAPVTAVDTPGQDASSLVLTRPDGTTFTFSDITVTCKPPLGGVASGRGQRIWLHSPIRLATEAPGEDERLEQPFVLFEGRLEQLQDGRAFTLPVDGPGDSESYPMTLFVADTEGAPDGNEVVSSRNSSGTVRVLRATCDPTPVLELEIDATLGSEEGKQSLDVAGSVG